MTRRTIVALALVAALGPLLFAGPAGAQWPGVTPTEIKIGNTNPYSGPASAYGTIGKALTAYFKKVNDEGGINGRKINFVTLDDGYSAEDGRDGPTARGAGPGRVRVPDARHADEQRDPQVPERAEGAAPVRGDRRHEVGRPAELPVDHGLAADLPDRGAHLRPVRPQERPEPEDRHPLPERRLREGLRQGAQGRPRRSGPQADR